MMKININNLEDGVTNFEQTQKDGWVKAVIQQLGTKGLMLDGPVDIKFSVTKLEPDYVVNGVLKAKALVPCARCAESFDFPIQSPLNMALVHLKSAAQKAVLEDESPDPEQDKNYFEGNEMDLAPIIEDQFLLSIPYQAYCEDSCKGLCQQCGQNLNWAQCQCKQDTDSGPFAVLKKLKH